MSQSPDVRRTWTSILRQPATWRISAAVVVAGLTVTLAEAGGPFRNPLRTKTSVEQLAEKIDKLERDLQHSGRVTVKAPDVWGQARLTAHREEFERQMAAQLEAFVPGQLNAAIATSDQSFLTQALALSMTGQLQTPSTATQTVGLGTTNTTKSVVEPGKPEETPPESVPPAASGNGGTTASAATDPKKTEIKKPVPTKVTYDTTATVDVEALALGSADLSGQLNFGGSLALEPEILLDQRKRFLDHLHEIRRINEGDDTADSPGYSLNLVRIPVSVVPGDKTRENFGAEVTLIAEPVVTTELLPSTFRELVINDLIDQLALPMVKILDLSWEDFQEAQTLRQRMKALDHDYSRLKGLSECLAQQPQMTRELQNSLLRNYELSVDQLTQPPSMKSMKVREGHLPAPPAWRDVLHAQLHGNGRAVVPPAVFDIQALRTAAEVARDTVESELLEIQKHHSAIVSKVRAEAQTTLGVQISRERRSRYPVPPSQLGTVFGEHEIQTLMSAAFAARDRFKARERMQLSDIQGFLRNELEAAYDFANGLTVRVADPLGQVMEVPVWNSHLIPTAPEIRQPGHIYRKRSEFFKSVPDESRTRAFESDLVTQEQDRSSSPISALCWAILVESSLLNQQLNDDLKQVSQDPNCECLAGMISAPCPFQFYGADPSPDARQAFVNYVKCRWPIRAFALDPVTQQQNVNDAFSLRRESQLAIALAFSKGFVGGQSTTQYMRRIEQDLRTISLNNTHVAFGAGDDTFGWRFFPRFQTLDVESHAKTIVRDHILGGPSRDQRVKNWRIEPGMRECVALVVMPSFIKHVRFDVRTNWFHLVPGSLETAFKSPKYGPTMEATVEWSETVRSIEDSVMMCVKDEHKYRVGEVDRLVKRAKQISQQLPLNTMYAQVPYENTLGGFEMFSSGVTDLAPELEGYYGSPGVDVERDTRLFLVGNNFSVHSTRVIAGNEMLDHRLLSREVMEVTIPRHVRVDRRLCTPREQHVVCNDADAADLHVEIRLATPYGVSSPLYVPVVNKLKEVPATPSAACPPPAEAASGSSSQLPAPAPSAQLYAPVLAPFPVEPPTAFAGYSQIKEHDGRLLPELHWAKRLVTLDYRATGTPMKYEVALNDIRMQRPFSFQIWSPADRPLPDGDYELKFSESSSPRPTRESVIPFPEDSTSQAPPTVAFNKNLTASGGRLVLEGTAFKDFHEALVTLVMARVNARPQSPASVDYQELTLRSTLTGSDELAVDEPLTIRVRISLPDAPVQSDDKKPPPTPPKTIKSTIKSKTVAAPAEE